MLLSKLHNKDLVIGLPKVEELKEEVCSACVRGKEVRSSLKSKKEISIDKPLELIHMDLCGPMRTPSRAGNRYILVIVDDFSRFTWTIFLSSKNEVFDEFMVWLKYVERLLDSSDRKSTRLNSSHRSLSRMPSSA